MAKFKKLQTVNDIHKAIPERTSFDEVIGEIIYIHSFEFREADPERGFKEGYDLMVTLDENDDNPKILSTSAWQVCAQLRHCESVNVHKIIAVVGRQGKSYILEDAPEEVPF